MPKCSTSAVGVRECLYARPIWAHIDEPTTGRMVEPDDLEHTTSKMKETRVSVAGKGTAAPGPSGVVLDPRRNAIAY